MEPTDLVPVCWIRIILTILLTISWLNTSNRSDSTSLSNLSTFAFSIWKVIWHDFEGGVMPPKTTSSDGPWSYCSQHSTSLSLLNSFQSLKNRSYRRRQRALAGLKLSLLLDLNHCHLELWSGGHAIGSADNSLDLGGALDWCCALCLLPNHFIIPQGIYKVGSGPALRPTPVYLLIAVVTSLVAFLM